MNRREYLKAVFGLALAGVAAGPGMLRAFRSAPPPPVGMDLPTLKLWRKAVAGDLVAQSELALAYQDGDGVPEDDKLAVYWLHGAAAGGDDFAQFWLGVRYEEGWGVRQNPGLAARLYRLASKDGYAEAEYALAGCYREGRGVPQDFAQAAYWYKRSADWGFGFGDEEFREYSAYARAGL